MAKEKLSLVIPALEIKRTVKRLAREISEDFKGEPLILIGVLKGAFIFLSDIAREIDNPVQLDFVRVYSYGSSNRTCGKVTVTKDVELDVRGRNVIIVEDILDSGCSLAFLLKHLKKKKPKVLKSCVIVDKDTKRKEEVKADYTGIKVPDLFLVGYGLDFNERYRNKKGIYSIEFK